MLNSVAFQLEYLSTVNKTFQNLINEELSRSFRPVLEDDDRTVRPRWGGGGGLPYETDGDARRKF